MAKNFPTIAKLLSLCEPAMLCIRYRRYKPNFIESLFDTSKVQDTKMYKEYERQFVYGTGQPEELLEPPIGYYRAIRREWRQEIDSDPEAMKRSAEIFEACRYGESSQQDFDIFVDHVILPILIACVIADDLKPTKGVLGWRDLCKILFSDRIFTYGGIFSRVVKSPKFLASLMNSGVPREFFE
ncbi:hypothetical protein BJ508DRAFT_316393 [Ascobolus immersus RN42]|uniref:Uncharacterized protein n=1 Tax=Ascobolus immersus RN42 TaxID=1160509 RepID=A0A3N4H6I7_ASCIM|nr:hypothetical protein BJ508DRAFT_316393 [Ascobolus immersus RN42]